MIDLKVFHSPGSEIPVKATNGSACFDLSSFFEENVSIHGLNSTNDPFDILPSKTSDNQLSILIQPLDRILIPTGLIFDIPNEYSLRIHARSGLSYKNGLILTNGEGIIDSDYVEPVYISITNISRAVCEIHNNTRIAQCELFKNISHTISSIPDKPIRKTSRAGGFGSTGKKKI